MEERGKIREKSKEEKRESEMHLLDKIEIICSASATMTKAKTSICTYDWSYINSVKEFKHTRTYKYTRTHTHTH